VPELCNPSGVGHRVCDQNRWCRFAPPPASLSDPSGVSNSRTLPFFIFPRTMAMPWMPAYSKLARNSATRPSETGRRRPVIPSEGLPMPPQCPRHASALIFVLPLLIPTLSPAVAPAQAPKDSATYRRLKAQLDAVPAIDTHDHLWPFD